MITVLRENYIRKTRKPHRCTGCLRTIDPPNRMILCVTAQEGTVYNDYFCTTCELIRSKRASESIDGVFEFSQGDLLEEALEVEEATRKIVTAIKNNPYIFDAEHGKLIGGIYYNG